MSRLGPPLNVAKPANGSPTPPPARGTFASAPAFRRRSLHPIDPHEAADSVSLRVLMFGWEFPPFQAGGLGTATQGLVKGLVRQGARVTLVVPFPIGAADLGEPRIVSAAAPMQSVRVHRVPTPLAAYGGADAYLAALERARREGLPTAVYGRNLMEEVERFAAVAGGIARREPHDLIDAHDWLTFGAGLRARAASGRPFVAHIHATEFDRSGEAVDPRIARRERRGLRSAARVIANSRRLRDLVVRRYGVPDSKVDVVHWGIDGERAAPGPPRGSPFPPDDPVVLFIGRVTRQKGPETFVRVARRVADHVPRVRFLLAGTGDLLPAVVEQAVALGLADRVHFAGPLAGDDVDRAYRLADVCVMPSVSEPFGLVVLESLRNGTPCIIPRTAGAAEAVRNAFKVDFWDVDQMASQVIALLRHPMLRDELSRRGLEELSRPRFSLEEPARLTLASYQRALAEARGA